MTFTKAVAAIVALGMQAPSPGAVVQGRPVPVPGNRACPYPDRAREAQIAGIVTFSAQVRADGAVESVEIGRAPYPELGFEETVRACVSEWRFVPAAGSDDAPRLYEGQVRFRRAPSEEVAVRGLLEQLAGAWNAHDEAAIADLQARLEDTHAEKGTATRPLLEQLRELLTPEARRIQLADDVELFWFLRPNLVKVRQPYRLAPSDVDAATAVEPLALEASLLKGWQGWRFVGVLPWRAPGGPLRVGQEIKEPRKVKNVAPVYPQIALQARVQGTVILDCVISPEGTVTDAKVLRGIPLLDQAAIDAVKRWRYTPTIVDGKAVPILMTVTVSFRLH